jgi:hypothetical protein
MTNCGLSLTAIKYERTILLRRREQVGIAFEARSLQHEALGGELIHAIPCCILDSDQRVCSCIPHRQHGVVRFVALAHANGDCAGDSVKIASD